MPLTAAIVGLSTAMLRPNCGRKSGGGISSAVVAISARSPPAQKALSPAPVSTSTAAASSALNRRTPSQSPARTAADSALRASGRSMVSQAIPFSTSYRTTSPIVDHRQDVPGVDGLPDVGVQVGDHAVVGGTDGVLHLHR